MDKHKVAAAPIRTKPHLNKKKEKSQRLVIIKYCALFLFCLKRKIKNEKNIQINKLKAT